MKISIFGLGYVGLTSAACLIKQGHTVIGVDISNSKVEMLNDGKCPINEPGVEDLLIEGIEDGRFQATTSSVEAIEGSTFSFVCVGTPSDVTGAHDMSYIVNVTEQIANAIKKTNSIGHSIAYRSTMVPGSTEELIIPIFRKIIGEDRGEKWDIFYNPEFLRESTAIEDYFNPPKVVVGHFDDADTSAIDEIYVELSCTKFSVSLRVSELTKFLDNSFHALKVAFGNEIGRICKTLSIQTEQVMDIFLADTKLNISPNYLRPGGAFGGSCLPKDVRALQSLAIRNGIKNELIGNIISSNESHKSFLVDMIENTVSKGAKILIAGLSFKTNTDDLRESPQIDLVQRLIGLGYDLNIYDPDIELVALHGKNLAFTHSHIPHLSKYMIDENSVINENFDFVVMTKTISIPTDFDPSKLIRIDSL